MNTKREGTRVKVKKYNILPREITLREIEESEQQLQEVVHLRQLDDQKGTSEEPKTSIAVYKNAVILSTLLPDEILLQTSVEKNLIRRFDAVLLFADVSGFTSLCEKYNMTGKGGTYRLTATLNTYIGVLVQVILSYGGDVLKFSGDAFLALWKVKNATNFSQAVELAIDCALYIQEHLGSFETDVGVELRVKIAISSGKVTFAIVGNETSKNYIELGPPILDVKLAELACTSGDVVVAPSSWQVCNSKKYEHELKPDNRHIKVMQLSKTFAVGGKTVASRSLPDLENLLKDFKSVMAKGGKPQQKKKRGSTELKQILAKMSVLGRESAKYRPMLNEAAKRRDVPSLRPYIFPPVLQQVDHELPLDYLSELRQVVTMFTNIITGKLDFQLLVDLADEAYCTIYRMTYESKGYVNKLSMFDKDLMFLVVFGLRGYKHEYECQSALKCAYATLQQLKEMAGVEKVSIGVTTGITYCGVVGHALRKEYTVIGGPVNKAARMMVAYEGKVTCDRNTFVFSKLPAHYFILQEPKALKGLENVGPIYQFVHEENNPTEASSVMFPLLGRKKELATVLHAVESMLEIRREKTEFSFPIYSPKVVTIEGETGIGKTRLLEALVDDVRKLGARPAVVLASSASLHEPFGVIYKLLCQLLGIDTSTLAIDKEEKILNEFSIFESANELCYINDIFKVKFPLKEIYFSETASKRKEGTHDIVARLIQKLAEGGIVTFVVDDAEFIDPFSWEIFKDVVHEPCAFTILTMNNNGNAGKHKLCEAAEMVLHDPGVIRIPLMGLEAKYLAPLACQILEVQAIPESLESTLAEKSNGNPGWCESFLVSLVQSGLLKLTPMKKEKALQVGQFVFTQMEHLWKCTATSAEDDGKEQFCSLVGQALPAEGRSKVAAMRMEWTHKQKHIRDFLAKEQGQSSSSVDEADSSLIIVGTLSEECNLSTLAIPNKLDGIILVAYDSLKPYEQLLLKCGAVLGEVFTRSNLVGIMHNPEPQATASAVKKLFDMRVWGCGHSSDYRNGRRRAVVEGDRKHAIKCFCEDVEDNAIGLPKYAYCKLLKFRSPIFRETTYDLLTDDQKRSLHAQSVHFLDGNTHKCIACGGQGVVHVPVYERDKPRRCVEPDASTDSLKSYYTASAVPHHADNEHDNSGMGIQESGTSLASLGRQLAKALATPWTSSVGRSGKKEEGGHHWLLKWFWWTRSDSTIQIFNRNDSTISIAPVFKDFDFRKCECQLILSCVHMQLISHCRAAGMSDKLVHFLLEAGEASIKVGDNIQALELLKEADRLLEEAKAEMNDASTRSLLRSHKHLKGRAHTLLGAAYLSMGNLDEAGAFLHSALKFYGKTFWTNKWMTKVQLSGAQVSQKVRRYLRRHSGNSEEAAIRNEMALTLSNLGQLYMLRKEWCLAHLSAVLELDCAGMSDEDFVTLCTAYRNVIEICYKYKHIQNCKQVERLGLKLCHRKVEDINADTVLAIGRLYSAIFEMKLLRGEIEAAINIGFKLIQFGNRIHVQDIKLYMLPLMAQALIMTHRLSEAVDILKQLSYAADKNSDRSAETWYYALCLDMRLDTGFSLEDYDACSKFLDDIKEQEATFRDVDAERRLFVSTWLRCVRNEEWVDAKAWEVESKVHHLNCDDTFSNTFTLLKLLECSLLYLVNKIESRNFPAYAVALREANMLFKATKAACERVQVAKPRYLHLKAYMQAIQKHTEGALKTLKKAKKLSILHGNSLESTWIDHSSKVWRGLVSRYSWDYWKEYNEGSVDWHESDLVNWSRIMFSFPMPKNSV